MDGSGRLAAPQREHWGSEFDSLRLECATSRFNDPFGYGNGSILTLYPSSWSSGMSLNQEPPLPKKTCDLTRFKGEVGGVAALAVSSPPSRPQVPRAPRKRSLRLDGA